MDVIEGRGAVITESRDVSGFDAIEVNMGAEVIIEQGDEESLTIEARESLLPYLTSEVQGNKLILATERGYSIVTTTPIVYRITVKDLEAITINGAVDLSGSDLSLDSLHVTVNGAGETTLTGTIGEQRISISGGMTYDARGVESERVTVEINGIGTVNVSVSDLLDVTINGTGTVTYQGNPEVKQEINGLGSINQE